MRFSECCALIPDIALWNIIQEGLNYRKTQGNQKSHEVSIHLKIWGGAPRLLAKKNINQKKRKENN